MTKPIAFTDWRNRSAVSDQKDEHRRLFYESDHEKVMTDGGQVIDLGDPSSAGQDWNVEQDDGHETDPSTSLTSLTNSRTTFHAKQADDEKRFNRYWSLQHGRGQTYEDWDKETRIRMKDVDAHRYISCILSNHHIVGSVQEKKEIEEKALQRMFAEPLQGFCAHYAGVTGAGLGFACLYAFDSPEEAKASSFAKYVDSVLDGADANKDAENLIDYVWGKYSR